MSLGQFKQLWLQLWLAGARQRRLVGFAVAIAVVSSILLVFESLQRGEVISALASREPERFGSAVVIFIVILVASANLLAFSAYLRDQVALQWRDALSQDFCDRYLQNQNYLQPAGQNSLSELDNPDQRIAEDIKNLSQTSLLLGLILIESIVQLIGFTLVLWWISPNLTVFLWVYATVGSLLASLVFGKRLTRINAEQLKREADFRFSLINAKENAESIAFYDGGAQEQRHAETLFSQAVQNFRRYINWQFGLDLFQNGYEYLTFIIPSIVLAPQILAGQLEIGAIVQSQAAFDRIWLSLSLIVVQFEQITTLTASLDRLVQFNEALQQPPLPQTLERSESPEIQLNSLTLNTERQCLIRDLSLTVPAGQHLLVMGPSGAGKSSLARAIAGLWPNATGTVRSPKQLMFLPQHPYMALGSLRQQLHYPYPAAEGEVGERAEDRAEDELLRSILLRVQLPQLADSDLDRTDDWSHQLSMGEQQRLAVGRLLLTQQQLDSPCYALLDEATTGLTETQEAAIYQQLLASQITLISIGHRPSLRAFHRQLLQLEADQSWSLQPLQGA